MMELGQRALSIDLAVGGGRDGGGRDGALWVSVREGSLRFLFTPAVAVSISLNDLEL